MPVDMLPLGLLPLLLKLFLLLRQRAPLLVIKYQRRHQRSVGAGFPLLGDDETDPQLKIPRSTRVISAEELGSMSKNNLRGITLVRGPIWGIHSLALIISCLGEGVFESREKFNGETNRPGKNYRNFRKSVCLWVK